MKVGDIVRYGPGRRAAWSAHPFTGVGMVVAIAPDDRLLRHRHAVSVLWSSGELVERTSPGILEVVNDH